MNIFVGNVSFDAVAEDIKKLFGGFGNVASAVIVTRKEKKTPKPRGFGFVEMPDQSQALAAIAALNGKEFMGRVLMVNPARLRKEFHPDSEPGKKAWPKVLPEAKRYPRQERAQKKSWDNLIFNKSGIHRGSGSIGGYQKRDSSRETPAKTMAFRRGNQDNPSRWPKREEQSRPWQKAPSEHKPWKSAEEGAGRPWRKAGGEAKPWSKPRRSGFKPRERIEGQSRPWRRPEGGFEAGKEAQGEAKFLNKPGGEIRSWRKSEGQTKPWSKKRDQSRPWQKAPSEHKPWKSAEEGAGRPWRKAGGEAKPWSKPRRSGFKPRERIEGQSRPWRRPEGGFEAGKEAQGEAKPWSKRTERPRRSGFNPSTSPRTALSEPSKSKGRGRTKGRGKSG